VNHRIDHGALVRFTCTEHDISEVEHVAVVALRAPSGMRIVAPTAAATSNE
jgi:hypothetical protein